MDRLLKNLHIIVRKDNFVQSLLSPTELLLHNIEDKILAISKEFNFSTMSMDKIKLLENEMAYKTSSKTLEGKRTELETRWKIKGKCTLKLLQDIANTWRNGEAEITFVDGIILVKFISITGIPNDLEQLKYALEEAKPAHLGIKYSFKYRVWQDLPPKNWKYYSKFTWKELMEKEGI